MEALKTTTSQTFSVETLIKSILGQLTYGLDLNFVNIDSLSAKVASSLPDNFSPDELYTLMAETSASLTTHHNDYDKLGGRILVARLHQTTNADLVSVFETLYNHIDPKNGKHAPLISLETLEIAKTHAPILQQCLDYSKDFTFPFFGFRTLAKSYLIQIEGQIIERPQHLYMRVAIGINGNNLAAILEDYQSLSDKFGTYATPTLINSGTVRPQMSSCFLITMKDDSIEGIYDTLKQCAQISQHAGGIGLSISNVRAKGSYIKGTGGTSNGIVPMLRNFDMTARYVDQGGGKRKGAFAVYLEPWHADIFEFLEMKKNHGKDEMRARDLFYGLWIPDLFMQRAEEGKDWSLFCPNEAPGLQDAWGEEFVRLYEYYEAKGLARKTFPARELQELIIDAQIETGNPYILYKDAANRKSNQKNLGTIKSSNLCTEIIEYSAPDETAVCNLASLSLPAFVINGIFDFQLLYTYIKRFTRGLNNIIDRNYYPVEEARNSNFRHRPIGLGVQGLADVFMMLNIAFDSEEAIALNKDIFETIYFAAMETSIELAEKDGHYSSFPGSPLSEGKFQFDLWNVTPSERYNWADLKSRVMKSGARNSLLVAPMPTASTSQILGNNECFEPYTSNMFTRRTLAGEFIVTNKHLTKALIARGLWNDTVRQGIIANQGSVQNIETIPADLKAVYKTVWEISQKVIIDMAADRGAFICQSQSLNIHLSNANFNKINSMHFYGWKKGLKTGMYYLRTTAAANAIQFTVDKKKAAGEAIACSLDNPQACEACGS